MIIDVSNSHNLQGKKYDYIKIAFILQHIQGSTSANQINYYFNRIFPNYYCNSHRIAQVIKQYPNYFTISKDETDKARQARVYSFKGSVKLSKSTKINWRNKSKEYFTNPL